jgi:hypothetical protein
MRTLFHPPSTSTKRRVLSFPGGQPLALVAWWPAEAAQAEGAGR